MVKQDVIILKTLWYFEFDMTAEYMIFGSLPRKYGKVQSQFSDKLQFCGYFAKKHFNLLHIIITFIYIM